YSFIMPYSLSDDGYILGVKGRDSYFRLNKADIEGFQARGQLPTPLPPYELSALDYAMGHILWAVPIFVAGAFGVTALKRRRRQRALPYFNSALGHSQNGAFDQAIADYS